MDGIVGHADIANSKIIIELKDTASFERLDFNSHTFRAYLRQLLYYLVMTNVEILTAIQVLALMITTPPVQDVNQRTALDEDVLD
jgi:hypothetical protein